MNHIIDRVDQTFPELGEVRQKVIQNSPPQSNNLIKEQMFVKLVDDNTR